MTREEQHIDRARYMLFKHPKAKLFCAALIRLIEKMGPVSWDGVKGLLRHEIGFGCENDAGRHILRILVNEIRPDLAPLVKFKS